MRFPSLSFLMAAFVALLVAGCTQPPDSKQTLTVFVVAPLTGPGASLGDYIRKGVEIGRKEVADEHGSDLRLEIQYLDSKNQPKEGLSAYEAARARRQPDAVIVAMSSVSKALAPVTEAENVFTVATTTAVTGLPQGTSNIVRIYPTSEDFVAPTAKYVAERHDSTAAFYVNDDFGRSNREAFAKLLGAGGKALVADEAFELAQTDHRTAIARVLARKPDSIFVTGYGPAYIAFIKQLREAAAEIPLYTEMSIANPAVLQALGDAAEGAVFAGTELELSEPTSPAAVAFKSLFRKMYGQDAFMVAGYARDSLKLIVAAALGERPRGTAPTKAVAVRLSPLDGAGGLIHLDSQGESRIPLTLMQRVAGRTIRLSTGESP